jgi:hypothetical protein
MTRPLGSFNKRVNLPHHEEDRQVSRPPRMAALHSEKIPDDRTKVETGGEKFAAGRGRSQRATPENRRFAGNALNVDLTPGSGQNITQSSGMRAAFAPPLLGGAESRSVK